MTQWNWELDERSDLPQKDDWLVRDCQIRVLDCTSFHRYKKEVDLSYPLLSYAS